MTLSVKRSVDFTMMDETIVVILPTVMQVFARHGINDTTITEVYNPDANLRPGRSFHKQLPCKAVDFRTWADKHGTQIDDGIRSSIVLDLRRELGPDYDVVSKPDHIHIENDPK